MKEENKIKKEINKIKRDFIEDQLRFLDLEEDMYLSLDFDSIDIDMSYWHKRLKDKISELKLKLSELK